MGISRARAAHAVGVDLRPGGNEGLNATEVLDVALDGELPLVRHAQRGAHEGRAHHLRDGG